MIINGDCMKVLDTLINKGVKADCLITDPPYGIDYKSNHRKGSSEHKRIINDDSLEWLPEFLNKINKILNNNTAHYMFCSYQNIDIFKQEIEKVFKYKNILVWDKKNGSMGDLTGNYSTFTEFIIFFQKGRRLLSLPRMSNLIRESRTQNKLHPTEKPVALIERLIPDFTNPGEIIIDPFMGSGTTGIAAVNTGRKFIGIEMDKDYYDVSNDRINKATQALLSK